MNYSFIPMNKYYANEIAYSWKYDDDYSFYDMTKDEDDLKEFLNENSWEGNYFVVINDENELVGFGDGEP